MKNLLISPNSNLKETLRQLSKTDEKCLVVIDKNSLNFTLIKHYLFVAEYTALGYDCAKTISFSHLLKNKI